MVWRRTDDKPLSEPMKAFITNVYMRYSASMIRVINQIEYFNLFFDSCNHWPREYLKVISEV